MAINCQPRWRERLGGITAPTLVVHGDEDPDNGQGVPRVTWPAVVDAVLRHTS